MLFQSFPESLQYNQETGLFEVASGEAEFVRRRITSVLHYSKLQLLTTDPLMLAGAPPVDNYYSVCCLDREQGIQWILKERLPLFLQSDCHSEYRLAKMFERERHRCVQRRKSVLRKLTPSDPQLYIPSQNGFMKMQSSHLLQSEEHLELQSSIIAPSSHSDDSRYHLAAAVVEQVLASALAVMESESQANTGDCVSQSEEETEEQSDEQSEDQSDEQSEEETEEQSEEETEEETEEQSDEQSDEQTEEQSEEETEEQSDEQTEVQTEEQSDKQTEEQSDEQTEEQSDKQTEVQSEEQTDEQTEEQSDKQTEVQSDEKPEEQSDEKSEGQTEVQTEEQKEGQSDEKSEGQTEVQTEEQSEEQSDEKSEGQTEVQTEGQTEVQTEEQLEEQSEEQSDEKSEVQTEKQSDEKSEGQTEEQSDEKSEGQTEEQLEEQTEEQSDEKSEVQTEEQLEEQTEEQSGCDASCQGKGCWLLADGSKVQLEGENDPEAKRMDEECEKSWEVVKQKNVLSICCHDSPASLARFKEFLRGTPGAKLLNLWMDIERLKAADSSERKSRYLVLMRNWYLQGSSPSSLHAELLSRLGLSTSPCWTEEKLCSVQPFITESLLHYWAPRFWTSYCARKDYDGSDHPGLETGWCVRLLPDSMTLPPYDLDPLQPQSQIAPAQFHFSRSQLPSSTTVERLLQALSVDLCAGLYLTHFCEQSGNQLWKNAVHFWTDLQYYRELFYQDGLDLYRVQGEAQLLYSTYLFSCARRSVGVDEGVRREVYDCMMPAFEELFDKVEEHALSILLEPWTLLVSKDQESFHKLSVHEEVRYFDSEDYRELQSLREELEEHLKQVELCGSMPFSSAASSTTPRSKDPQVPDSWSAVSPDYQSYTLGSLFQHPHEVRHFMSFLQDQDAGIHLSCWLDLEQYRRTPQKDKATRQKRSSHIATEYLDRKYFFGDDSPATIEQQNHILHLAGGLERLKPDCVSNLVLVELQGIVRSHIEREWLPLFLSSAEFTERQKPQAKPQTADRLLQPAYRQRRARRAGWKADNLWMSSSKEILLFRRILLNPVTCTQFQHFVSVKGEFLENDVLFWLEVQRYKDLCHSHCDEATIQQKISTIINCFINSSVPPALQIDIPAEQAQRILEKRRELGPYIFREAQMSVLGELLRFWPEFQELRCSVEEERLLPLLQEKRSEHRARAQRRRRKEEEAKRDRAQEALGRPQSVFREEEETLDDEEAGEQHEGRLTPTQSLSWSYSKYMEALKREEVLLRRQSQLEASVSTDSVSSLDVCSVRSVCSKSSSQQASYHSPRAERQCSTYNRGVRPTVK
ncbi:uncharacterized protein V6R79_024564 [Siganus canaliculatus]